MKLFSLLCLFAFSQVSYAVCTINKENLKVKWTAFKTPQKVGVSGTFTDLKYSGNNTGTSLETALKDASLVIDSSKIDTGNPARDTKIIKFFFSNAMGDNKITAKVKSVHKNVATLQVTMNNKTVEVPLSIALEKGELSATGHLDILDFSMSKSLKAINKACYALHEGKTWSHVVVEVMTQANGC